MTKKLASRFELVEEESPEGYREILYRKRPANLSDLLHNTVSRWPDETAFVDGGQRITYGRFMNVEHRTSNVEHRMKTNINFRHFRRFSPL